MLQCTYEEARAHLGIVVGIDLEGHLDFRHPKQLKFYSQLGALLVVYRYADALGQRMTIFDIFARGTHESHIYGTDLDFDYGPDPHDPVNQANVISDLLRVKDAMVSQMTAFRLGFYFDKFENTEVKTFDAFKATYGNNTNKSMHLG